MLGQRYTIYTSSHSQEILRGVPLEQNSCSRIIGISMRIWRYVPLCWQSPICPGRNAIPYQDSMASLWCMLICVGTPRSLPTPCDHLDHHYCIPKQTPRLGARPIYFTRFEPASPAIHPSLDSSLGFCMRIPSYC